MAGQTPVLLESNKICIQWTDQSEIWVHTINPPSSEVQSWHYMVADAQGQVSLGGTFDPLDVNSIFTVQP